MRPCLEGPAVGVIIDVPLSTDRPFPFLAIAKAEKILQQIGRGGHALVRTPFIDTFRYAAKRQGFTVSFSQTFRNGVPMHRMFRLR